MLMVIPISISVLISKSSSIHNSPHTYAHTLWMKHKNLKQRKADWTWVWPIFDMQAYTHSTTHNDYLWKIIEKNGCYGRHNGLLTNCTRRTWAGHMLLIYNGKNTSGTATERSTSCPLLSYVWLHRCARVGVSKCVHGWARITRFWSLPGIYGNNVSGVQRCGSRCSVWDGCFTG